jgi:hypothetical protein
VAPLRHGEPLGDRIDVLASTASLPWLHCGERDRALINDFPIGPLELHTPTRAPFRQERRCDGHGCEEKGPLKGRIAPTCRTWCAVSVRAGPAPVPRRPSWWARPVPAPSEVRATPSTEAPDLGPMHVCRPTYTLTSTFARREWRNPVDAPDLGLGAWPDAECRKMTNNVVDVRVCVHPLDVRCRRMTSGDTRCV